MIAIPTISTAAFSRDTVLALNKKHTEPFDKNNINRINEKAPQSGTRRQPPPISTKPLPPYKPPQLKNCLRQGQKTAFPKTVSRIRITFGWRLKNEGCDVDASAFMLSSNGKVPGDEWLVFYGQRISPDRSTVMDAQNSETAETIRVNLAKVDPKIVKIVFVFTIHEAFQRNMNFSMLDDLYMQITDEQTQTELFSYQIEKYPPTVTSMTVGEVYLHKNEWKFNPVGNGLHQDLAGQCSVYGVEIE